MEGKGRISALAIGRKKANQSGTDGSTIRLLKLYEVSVNLASMLTHASQALDVTLTGVTTDDIVIAAEPQAALEAGIGIDYVRVKAADTITIGATNNTASTVDAAAVNFKFLVARIADADV